MIELLLAFREVSPIFFTYIVPTLCYPPQPPLLPSKKINQGKESSALWPRHGFILEFEERKVSYSILSCPRACLPKALVTLWAQKAV